MKPGEAQALAREWRLFLKRVGILTVILIGFATYGLRALKMPFIQADLGSKATPELREILHEAEMGIVGPAMRRAMAEAEARGDLDRPFPHLGGKSLRQIMAEAQALAEKARSLPREIGLEPGDKRPEDDDPALVVPLMIKDLQHPEPSVRMQAAMTLADIKFAAHSSAESATPYLEPLLKDSDPDVRWFAELALKRIRHFATGRKFGSVFTQ